MTNNGKSGQKKDTQQDRESELEKVARSYRVAWVYAEYAFQYGITIVLCAGIGYFLDKWLNTGNVLLIIGVFFGAFAGFVNLLRVLNKKTTLR
ncbi:MAG TPA: AtpZ/AtpI family protein [Ignavibacteria bacterium]|jgi:F0F1-type ATP synthase assembly protein I